MNLSANNRSVLISPLGASKGLLFSALSLIKPDFCLVLTGKEYAGIAEEIFKILPALAHLDPAPPVIRKVGRVLIFTASYHAFPKAVYP